MHQMRDIGEALTKANTPDAFFRKLVLLQDFYAAGRGGEVAGLKWELAEWDYWLYSHTACDDRDALIV